MKICLKSYPASRHRDGVFAGDRNAAIVDIPVVIDINGVRDKQERPLCGALVSRRFADAIIGWWSRRESNSGPKDAYG